MEEDTSAYGTAVEALLRMYDSSDAAPEDYFREFGQLLRIYRESRYMTQSQLARQMFVGRSWVNRLEKGEGRASRNLIIHVGYVLGLTTPEVNILLFLSRHSPILKKRGDKGLRGLLLM
jgi:transcriptional regulator with XRE-family HTH domain